MIFNYEMQFIRLLRITFCKDSDLVKEAIDYEG